MQARSSRRNVKPTGKTTLRKQKLKEAQGRAERRLTILLLAAFAALVGLASSASAPVLRHVLQSPPQPSGGVTRSIDHPVTLAGMGGFSGGVTHHTARQVTLASSPTVDPNTYTYDADGNMLTGGGRVNTFDGQNRLVQCVYKGHTSTFTYGADGLRHSATVDGVTTYFVYDGQNMVQELQRGQDGQLHPSATYLTGPRGPECRIDETHQDEGYYDPASPTKPAPLQMRGRTSWYVYDGLGSVVGEVDQNGNMTASTKYDAYGAVRGRTGTASTQHGFVGSLGHLSEPNTGLIYMRARYYDPIIGRFISEDPAQNGVNWFSYVNNNPIMGHDYSGMIEGEDDYDEQVGETGEGLIDKIESIFGQNAKEFNTNVAAKSYLRKVLTQRGDDITDEEAGKILEGGKEGLDMGGADNVRIGKDGSIFTPNGKWLGDAMDFLD